MHVCACVVYVCLLVWKGPRVSQHYSRDDDDGGGGGWDNDDEDGNDKSSVTQNDFGSILLGSPSFPSHFTALWGRRRQTA